MKDITLPTALKDLLHKRKSLFPNKHENDYIGQGGFIPSDSSILFDAITALLLGKNILLKGPTGSGKTKLAETLSAYLRQPMESINCSVDLDAEGLLGFKTIQQSNNGAVIDFIPGPVIHAMQKGHLLYIDEINMAKPETLPILNGVLDYRRMILNPFTGDVVKASESFTVIAAINEGYIGTVSMNEALKNRFVVIEVPYIQGLLLKEVIEQQSKLRDDKLIEKFVKLSNDLFVQVQNGQVSEEAASIRALLDTCDLAVYLPPLRAVQRGIIDKLEDTREKAAIQNIAETLFE
ncbi:ATP-binding protein [Heyndrickxia ginsengihumi]|uniref:ATP-binding protein n=1 Tax=Heyndrickxia ginsengihumi TaxID=363870 RepID=UPI0004B37821|nr:MoxR family ATPase [Heyndrickxia ginsengihumi]